MSHLNALLASFGYTDLDDADPDLNETAGLLSPAWDDTDPTQLTLDGRALVLSDQAGLDTSR